MADPSHAVEHSIVHADYHGGRVLVVSAHEAEAVEAEFKRLFPRDMVLSAPMGCGHVCIYTHGAPASLVAEHIALHITQVEHSTLSYGTEARPPAPARQSHADAIPLFSEVDTTSKQR